MLNKIYLILGICVVVFYGLTGFFGWEFFTSQRRQLPSEVRSSSGIRSHNYWHDGYHGGK